MHPGQFPVGPFPSWTNDQPENFYRFPFLDYFNHEKFKTFPPWKDATLDFEQFLPLKISNMNNSQPDSYPPKLSMSCNCLAIFQVGNFLRWWLPMLAIIKGVNFPGWDMSRVGIVQKHELFVPVTTETWPTATREKICRHRPRGVLCQPV